VERRDNGDAHLKRQVMGREVVVAVTDGRFDFGPWEQIFYGEFDGGREGSARNAAFGLKYPRQDSNLRPAGYEFQS
jgi:thiamine phosphate synthase YjbQ (UPF0047 family)